MKIMPMVSMRMTPSEAAECYYPTSADLPEYPCGLSISLCEDELEKLGIEYEDLDIDVMVHMHCLAVVISKSKTEKQNGDPDERISLQITNISAEDEDEENEESVEKKLYR